MDLAWVCKSAVWLVNAMMRYGWTVGELDEQLKRPELAWTSTARIRVAPRLLPHGVVTVHPATVAGTANAG